VTPFAEFVSLCRRLGDNRGRLEKRRLLAEFLRGLDPAEIESAVAFLTGRTFMASDRRVLSVRGLPGARPLPSSSSLTIADVAAAFGEVAAVAGPGARRLRETRLAALIERASGDEREILGRIVGGEMRTGASEGIVLEAIAEAAGADAGVVRRAVLFLGDLSAVAALARRGGAAALASVGPRLFVPLLPMLAETSTDFADILASHNGRTALEYKYDGARAQLHSDGSRVAIWTRGLADVTTGLPDLVSLVRREVRGAPLIVDGEVVALDSAGRPRPFQELMRRFRRIHDVASLVSEVPLSLYLFDCLMVEGRSLIDEPYQTRWSALVQMTGGHYLAERAIVTTVDAGQQFHARAREAGHEGVMAKDPDSLYAPGSRGKRWFKLKSPDTIDCVIVAADRGSGRRQGWLSNYHLAVLDHLGYAEVGKTFKGLTDHEFAEMTARLRALTVSDDGYTVRVRPQTVVEVAYNEIQKSPTYRSGLALRFARIVRVRDDKDPAQATTLAELRGRYERQFETKGLL
jgi:DNA ligase 1